MIVPGDDLYRYPVTFGEPDSVFNKEGVERIQLFVGESMDSFLKLIDGVDTVLEEGRSTAGAGALGLSGIDPDKLLVAVFTEGQDAASDGTELPRPLGLLYAEAKGYRYGDRDVDRTVSALAIGTWIDPEMSGSMDIKRATGESMISSVLTTDGEPEVGKNFKVDRTTEISVLNPGSLDYNATYTYGHRVDRRLIRMIGSVGVPDSLVTLLSRVASAHHASEKGKDAALDEIMAVLDRHPMSTFEWRD